MPYLLTPTYTIVHPFCTETTGEIIIDPQPNYTYSFDGGITYQTSNTSGPIAPGSYIVKVQSALGCTSAAIYTYITDPTGIPPAPTGNASQLFCIFNNPTIEDLNVQGSQINWYSSATGTVPIAAGTSLLNGGTYFATQTTPLNCESPVRLQVDVAVIAYDLPVEDYFTLICDDLNDNAETANLSDYNGMLIDIPANYQMSYYSTFAGADGPVAADQITNPSNFPLQMGANIFYVRVLATNGCWKVATLKLSMIPAPFNTMLTSYILCENYTVTLEAPAGFDGYLWSTDEVTRTITVDQPGDYWVTVSEDYNNGVICSTTTAIEVILSNPPVIEEIEISDWTDNNNAIEVHLSSAGIGDYEYSIDGVNYQQSNIFNNLESGVYKVYVRDRNECGDDDADAFLLTYPQYFTPNNDGINDSWHIKFARNEADLLVNIFDRQGKFIKQLFGDGLGWDGTMNGHELPSTDYWFVVTRASGKVYKGHFAMKR
jgi:gliding motility-associated-like protein